MENAQKINCDVETCKYNSEKERCTLNEINVKNEDKKATEKEETICASYEINEEE